MKLIKNLIMAVGLMVLSSVSFASTVTNVGSAGSTGSIHLTSDGDTAFFSGSFNASNGEPLYDFWDLDIDGSSDSVGATLNSNIAGNDSTVDFILFQDANNNGLFDEVNLALIANGDDMFNYAVLAGFVTNGVNGISAFLATGVNYFLLLTGEAQTSYSAQISAVPVPAAGILFASALFGAGFLGRRKKKATQSNMIGAFARTA